MEKKERKEGRRKKKQAIPAPLLIGPTCESLWESPGGWLRHESPYGQHTCGNRRNEKPRGSKKAEGRGEGLNVNCKQRKNHKCN